MSKTNKYINVEIDKLTRSIENSITGEVFETDISILELKQIKLIKNHIGFLIGIKKLMIRQMKSIN